MVGVNVEPFEVEVRGRTGDLLRGDVYLPSGGVGPFPIVLGASPYQKALRHLPPNPVFPFTEYGPIQLYLDHGYAYVAMDLPGTGRSEGTWDPVSRTEGEAIHDMIEHVAVQPWSTGAVGMIGMSHYCWSQWNAARTRPPHLRTIVAYDGATDMYRDWMYHGGIPIQGFLNTWRLPGLAGAVRRSEAGRLHDAGRQPPYRRRPRGAQRSVGGRARPVDPHADHGPGRVRKCGGTRAWTPCGPPPRSR
ncbi:CocE/NonD family hydrolase [Streptomyces yokosukanensis]